MSRPLPPRRRTSPPDSPRRTSVPRPAPAGRRSREHAVVRPLSIAVTGGIGAGKSEALAAFARRGAAVLSSDDVVHRLFRDDEEVRSAVVERFGDRVVTERGEIDRQAIARIVFEDRAQLEWLERLLHPRVAREQLTWKERVAAQPTPPELAVTEIPLLYEVGGEAGFDAVVVITAPAGVRRARAKVSPEGRERRLIPDEEKVRRADFAYVNDGTLEELDAFVGSVVEELAARR